MGWKIEATPQIGFFGGIMADLELLYNANLLTLSAGLLGTLVPVNISCCEVGCIIVK
jgi:hypothetical protein